MREKECVALESFRNYLPFVDLLNNDEIPNDHFTIETESTFPMNCSAMGVRQRLPSYKTFKYL